MIKRCHGLAPWNLTLAATETASSMIKGAAVQVSLVLPRIASIAIGICEFGIDLDGLVIICNSCLQIPFGAQNQTVIIVKGGIPRFEPDRSIDVSYSSIQITPVLPGIATVVICRAEARIDVDGPGIVSDAAVQISLISPGIASIVVGKSRECLIEQKERPR